MDEALKARIANAAGGEQILRLADRGGDAVELLANANATSGERVPLKPLAELYGAGTGKASVDLRDDEFLALLMAIEESIVRHDRGARGLTDGTVIGSLDRLCMTPEADVRNDPLALDIQASLRLTLSLNDFSRQDVKHALRKVKQSVNRHNKLSGTRGYLTIIREQLP